MTGKNNEKYVDEGSYKYNNSFQKLWGGLCRQKLHVQTRYMSSLCHYWFSSNQPTRTGTEEPEPEQPIQALQSIGVRLQHSHNAPSPPYPVITPTIYK